MPPDLSSTQPPLVSAVIPTYNYAHLLSESIDSALAQDFQSIEVIVADDGSTDNTSEVLDKYGDKIRALKLDHAGPGAARNAALRAARGQYIAFLDADDLWLPDKITQQVQAFKDHPDAGLCHTGLDIFGEDEPDSTYILDPDNRYEGWCFEDLFHTNQVATSTAMLHRRAFPAHGFYEDMPITQDYALWLQVLFSYPAIYLPTSTTRKRRHVKQTTHDRRKRWKIYEGIGRLRLLDAVGFRMRDDTKQRLKQIALDQLNDAAYDHYWRKDYGWAKVGLKWLHNHGRKIPWRHRAYADLRWAIRRLTGQQASESKFVHAASK